MSNPPHLQPLTSPPFSTSGGRSPDGVTGVSSVMVSNNEQHDVSMDEHLSGTGQSEYRKNVGDPDNADIRNKES
ncbi:hypothetical protein V6N13_025352 [Hibiscus sabdariffa]|uniref:Uncharacterized protein n=1 Tax=Hibiscus sabdariffa TaxID=183260 RepID=A0ABR2BME5_9ROSI